MAFQVSTISPEQQLQYQQGRSNARTENAQGQARNAYQQGLLQQGYQDDTQDFNTQWNRQREGMDSTFIQGGTFRSGIRRDALRKYAIDRLAAQRRMQRGFQERASGLVFDSRGMQDDYTQTVANLFGNQYAAQAQIASALRGIM